MSLVHSFGSLYTKSTVIVVGILVVNGCWQERNCEAASMHQARTGSYSYLSRASFVPSNLTITSLQHGLTTAPHKPNIHTPKWRKATSARPLPRIEPRHSRKRGGDQTNSDTWTHNPHFHAITSTVHHPYTPQTTNKVRLNRSWTYRISMLYAFQFTKNQTWKWNVEIATYDYEDLTASNIIQRTYTTNQLPKIRIDIHCARQKPPQVGNGQRRCAVGKKHLQFTYVTIDLNQRINVARDGNFWAHPASKFNKSRDTV